MKTRVVTVDSCDECPFADQGDGEAFWLCSVEDKNGDLRVIPRRPQHAGELPRWCPLRTADQLVGLRSKT